MSSELPLGGIGRRRLRRRTPALGGLTGYAFLAPNLIGLTVFTFMPLVFVLFVSFARWNLAEGLGGLQWVGALNYSLIIRDPGFWQSAGLTLVYVACTVPPTMVFGLAVAMALNGPIPGRSVLRLIFFIPFVANMVAIGETWIILYSPRGGPIAGILQLIGINEPPVWLASSTWALPALILMTIWYQVGYAALLYSAAIQDIPKDLLEAATLDGASAWSRFTHVTLPLLTPITFLLFLTGFIFTSQSFGFVALMTRGGPGQSTTLLSYYIYQNAFQFYHFGYAAAMSVAMLAMVAVVALAIWAAQRWLVHYE